MKSKKAAVIGSGLAGMSVTLVNLLLAAIFLIVVSFASVLQSGPAEDLRTYQQQLPLPDNNDQLQETLLPSLIYKEIAAYIFEKTPASSENLDEALKQTVLDENDCAYLRIDSAETAVYDKGFIQENDGSIKQFSVLNKELQETLVLTYTKDGKTLSPKLTHYLGPCP